MGGTGGAFIENFPPVFGADARVLILGSMPGRVSLEANQYYAHPRNHFWFLMESLLGISRGLDYQDRLAALKDKKVALWDSAWRCVRHASADATMDEIRASDFGMLFEKAPDIQAIYFNGRKSEEVFRRYALPGLSEEIARLPMCYLPSTSPANAGTSYEEKCSRWAVILDRL